MTGGPSGPAPHGEDTDVVYGLLRLAGMDVALPLAALREVVPCPAELTPVPAAVRGLMGSISLRSLVLPVADLRPSLDLSADRHTGQVVVVVADGGQVLGLLADAVMGVTRVAEHALLAMSVATPTDGPPLFSHAFRHADDGRTVYVLDAGALLRAPGMPTVTDPAVTAAATAAVSALSVTRARRTFTLAQCGPYRLALDVAAVHTTLPSSATRPSVLDDSLCRGVLSFDGSEVPVVDPLVLMGLPALPPEDTGAGLVLRIEDGYVVLAASELLDLVQLGADDVLPVADFAVARSELLAGLAGTDASGPCLVVDETALTACAELRSLASVNTSLDVPEQTVAEASTAGRPDGGRPYVTFSAGVTVATALAQVTEILPFPDSLTPTAADEAVLGVVLHRRAAMPVLCLSRLLGQVPAPVTAETCLLVVQVDGSPVAFTVEALHGIEPLSWSDPAQPGPAGLDGPHVSLRACRLVQLGQSERLLPELDLQALARARSAIPARAALVGAPAQ